MLAVRPSGHDLQVVLRTAAASRGIFSDIDLAEASGVHRNTVTGWWKGATMQTDAVRRVAAATGLSEAELSAYVHYGGPPPTIVWPSEPLSGSTLTPEQHADAEQWEAEAIARNMDSGGNSPQRPRPRPAKGG